MRTFTLLLLGMLICAAGCAPLQQGKSPLKPARLPPDSVVLEIFFVRFPFGASEGNDAVWTDVDEQGLPVEVRHQLAEQGFRVGVIGGTLPMALEHLMDLKNQEPETTPATEAAATDLEGLGKVRKRHMQLRSGRRGEILASDIHDELPVLVSHNGQIEGRTYPKAQCVYGIVPKTLGDGMVDVELTPELQYGEAQQQFKGADGVFQVNSSRRKEVYESLRVSTHLAAGQSLLVGMMPNRAGTLAEHFFSEPNPHSSDQNPAEQKLLLIRVSQTQYDDLFSETPGKPAAK